MHDPDLDRGLAAYAAAKDAGASALEAARLAIDTAFDAQAARTARLRACQERWRKLSEQLREAGKFGDALAYRIAIADLELELAS